VKVGALELAGGAWVTRGYAVGGRPGAWTSVGFPIGFDALLTVGIDYTPLTWTGDPSLRGMMTVRKRFSLPMPFVTGTPLYDPRAGAATSPLPKERP
jgi:hypothetical protein